MKVLTRPLVKDGQAFVELHVGSEVAQLTATQAEQIAESLNRGATASRYEAGIAELLRSHGYDAHAVRMAVVKVRENVQSQHAARS